MTDATVVLFRRYPFGDVVALMPEVPGDPQGNYAVCVSGNPCRHYPAEVLSVLATTEPAEENDYKRLKRAMEQTFSYTVALETTSTPGQVLAWAGKRHDSKADYAKLEKIRHLY